MFVCFVFLLCLLFIWILFVFLGRKASRVGAKGVAGTSRGAGLWGGGIGQWKRGYGQWEMMVPGGQDGKRGCPGNLQVCEPRPRGVGGFHPFRGRGRGL